MLELAVDFKDFPKGEEFDVGGIVVKNKETTKLTEDQEQMFAARHGSTVKDYFKESKAVKVSGTSSVTAKDLEGGGS